jgi:TetR/AcrR family transcriptional repressor of nem operon
MEVSETDSEIKALMTEHFRYLENAFDQALQRDGFSETQGKASFLGCVAQGLNVLARTGPERTTLEQIVSNALLVLK